MSLKKRNNVIISGKRGVTPATVLRLAKYSMHDYTVVGLTSKAVDTLYHIVDGQLVMDGRIPDASR